MREERERIERLAPEARAKAEEKLQKEEKKKMMRKRMKVVRM